MSGGKGGKRNGKGEEGRGEEGKKIKILATGVGRIVKKFFSKRSLQTGTLCIFEVVHWLLTA